MELKKLEGIVDRVVDEIWQVKFGEIVDGIVSWGKNDQVEIVDTSDRGNEQKENVLCKVNR